MSICVDLIGNTFKFKKENSDVILKTLKEFVSNVNDLRYIDENSILHSDNIEECFEEIGYPLEEDDDFFCIDYCRWEKFNDEKRIFNAIAKYIEKGSYLEYSDGDGQLFRLVFDGQKCKRKYPQII